MNKVPNAVALTREHLRVAEQSLLVQCR